MNAPKIKVSLGSQRQWDATWTLDRVVVLQKPSQRIHRTFREAEARTAFARLFTGFAW